jgi:hypothetical protein
MQYLNVDQLVQRVAELRAQSEAMNKELEELSLLITLARKYLESQPHDRPKPITADDALRAVQGAVERSQSVPKRRRIVEAAAEILSDGRRRLSREMLTELLGRGVEVGGAPGKEAASLASYLSKDDQFVSDIKAGGWTLKRFLQKAKPGNASTLPGFFTNGVEATHP